MEKIKQRIIYRDNRGMIEGKWTNLFNEANYVVQHGLMLELEKAEFGGDAFDGLELMNEAELSKTELERFTLVRQRILEGKEEMIELTDYSLEFDLPIRMINIEKNKEEIVETQLTVKRKFLEGEKGREYSSMTLEFLLNGEKVKLDGDVFEVLLLGLKEKMKDEYYMKNCFGCLYSDYSPYGNDTFGDMLCFRNNKENYAKVNDKTSMFKTMEETAILNVQEIHLCDQFKPRISPIGYRG